MFRQTHVGIDYSSVRNFFVQLRSGTGSGSPRSKSRLRLHPNWVSSGTSSRKKNAAVGSSDSGSGSRH